MKITKEFEMKEMLSLIEASSASSSIYVGTDSLRIKKKKKHHRFVTVVIIHFDSCKGATWFTKHSTETREMSMKERLLTEVYLSVATALEIAPAVGDRNFEVHVDVNPNEKHRSHVAHREATAYVVGQGFKMVSKPDSFAATISADRVLRKGANA